jgi:hypothetical protein
MTNQLPISQLDPSTLQPDPPANVLCPGAFGKGHSPEGSLLLPWVVGQPLLPLGAQARQGITKQIHTMFFMS